eukprot:m.264370 g.264370  ORF g.264370 m.264370 type:complete len:54 (-) comp26722_c0_seq2:44-205(-)
MIFQETAANSMCYRGVTRMEYSKCFVKDCVLEPCWYIKRHQLKSKMASVKIVH